MNSDGCFSALTRVPPIPHSSQVVHPPQALRNFEGMLCTLRNSSIPVSERVEAAFLSPELQPLSPHARSALQARAHAHGGCLDAAAMAAGKYAFIDKRDDTRYPVDPGKAVELAAVLRQAGKPNQLLRLPEGIKRCGVHIRPLAKDDYEVGLPMLLSAETGHCDIPGGAGCNYPLAEYLSDRGRSCSLVKIAEGQERYLGHFNVWKLNDGRYLLGTLALRSDGHCATDYLRAALWSFAEALLQQDPSASSVLLGLGGQNLQRLFPGAFEPGKLAHVSLGVLRHAEPEVFSARMDAVAHLRKVTGLAVVPGPLHIGSETVIGMEPQQRLDMKNAMQWLTNMPTERAEVQQRCLTAEARYQAGLGPQAGKTQRTGEWENARMLKHQRIDQAMAHIVRWHPDGEWIKTGKRDMVIRLPIVDGAETRLHYRCQREAPPILRSSLIRQVE